MNVFISHSERDVEALHALEDALSHEGIDFYVAEEHPLPGMGLSSKVREAISKSDVIIALMTEAGASSPSVNQEVGIAITSDMTVVPLVRDGVSVGVFLDDLEQFRFDDHTLISTCARAARYLSELNRGGQDSSNDPYLTRVSMDFISCRNGAYAFHNCSPSNVRNLLLSKYDYFIKHQELHYPRFLDDARNNGQSADMLLAQLYEQLKKAPEGDRDRIVADYVSCQYLIDSAVVAHLELRKAWRELPYRDECERLANAYSQRLRNLYDNEVRFGRSEVYRFIQHDDIITLLNAQEKDAIDYIVTYLTDAMWYQLNGSHGWFDEEVRLAEENAEAKVKILNKARQVKAPLKRKLWRRTKNA